VSWAARTVLTFLLALGTAQARGRETLSHAIEDCGDEAACLRRLRDAHPVRAPRFWQAFAALPLDRRILVAPERLVEYLEIDNRLHGFPNHPRRATVGKAFMRDIRAAVAELPESVRTLVAATLKGVFLVEDLGGTGYTDYVLDAAGIPEGAFVVLDTGALNRSANEWATWKENSPFLPEPGFALQAILEEDADDNPKQAIQFILLHEFGHVVSVGRRIHPRWDRWDCATDPVEAYPYATHSWRLVDPAACTVGSRFDESVLDRRTEVIYYFGARLPLSEAPALYAALEQTDFPSLYAATKPGDDFAEAFALYVHQRLMGKPFEVLIRAGDAPPVRFTGCWDRPRCADKQALLADLFADPR